jgi:spore maturation protein CgeB
MTADPVPRPERRLKVLVIGNGTLDCAEVSCLIALRAMGHEATYFDPEEHPAILAPLRRTYQTKRYVNRILDLARLTSLYERAMIDTVVDQAPDLVLVIPINVISVQTIAEITRRTRARVAGWFQDAVVNFGTHEFLLADYDALFFKDPYIIERLGDHGGFTNLHLLPEACEPSIHHSLPLTEDDRKRYGADLMVYGTLYAYRIHMLAQLAAYDLRIYGLLPVPRLRDRLVGRADGQIVYRDEKIKAVLSAKIIINSCHFGEVRSANARLFEVAGIGGFQLSDAPGAADFFEPGVEIATFKGPKQLREMVDHFLAHPEERAAMAARAQRRAHRDHTFAKRLERIIETVGLGARPSAQTERAMST